MSGSRDHFTDKLKQELHTALSLLMKNLAHHAVDLTLPVTLCVMITTLNPQSYAAALDVEAPPLHEVTTFEQTMPSQVLPLEISAALAPVLDHGCEFTAQGVTPPMVADMAPPLHAVDFAAMSEPLSQALPIQQPVTTLQSPSIPLGPLPAPNTDTWPCKLLMSRTLAMPLPDAQRRSRGMPSDLYVLPVRKVPIPPHRFSTALRSRFKQVLAEKNNTFTGNIQLGVAFDRMDMSLYSAITQDENGHLLCTPKPEFTGQTTTARSRFEGIPAYLVFGTRLDSGTSVKALVPIIVDPLEENHE